MTNDNIKIKQIEGLTDLGLTVSEAVTRALDCSLTEFADRHGFKQPEVSMCLNAYHQRGYPFIRDAICAELGVEREWLDNLIDTQKRTTEGAA